MKNDSENSAQNSEDEVDIHKTSIRVPASIERLRRELRKGNPVAKDGQNQPESDGPSNTRSMEEYYQQVTPNWGTSELSSRHYLHVVLPDRNNLTLTFPLSEIKTILIGRTDAQRGFVPDIDIVGLGYEDAGVSRKHAALEIKENQVQVRDLASTNGTYLNGKRVQPEQPRILRNGDNLRMGDVNMTIVFSI